MSEAVADASALVDLLLGNERGDVVSRRLAGHELHAPASADVDVLSASRDLPLITTDRRLHPVSVAEVVVA